MTWSVLLCDWSACVNLSSAQSSSPRGLYSGLPRTVRNFILQAFLRESRSVRGVCVCVAFSSSRSVEGSRATVRFRDRLQVSFSVDGILRFSGCRFLLTSCVFRRVWWRVCNLIRQEYKTTGVLCELTYAVVNTVWYLESDFAGLFTWLPHLALVDHYTLLEVHVYLEQTLCWALSLSPSLPPSLSLSLSRLPPSPPPLLSP